MTDREAFEDFWINTPETGLFGFSTPTAILAWMAWQAALASERAKQEPPRIPTSCGYCTFEEADGELIEQCPRCKAADAQQAEPVARLDIPKQKRDDMDIFVLDDVAARKLGAGQHMLYAAPPAVQDSWEETARQYAENAKYWRERYEATQKQAEPVFKPIEQVIKELCSESAEFAAEFLAAKKSIEDRKATPPAVQAEPVVRPLGYIIMFMGAPASEIFPTESDAIIELDRRSAQYPDADKRSVGAVYGAPPQPASQDVAELVKLLAHVYDNLNDMPISEAWAKKTAERIYAALAKWKGKV